MTAKYRYDVVGRKFTGQKRDNETGLDYFEARYFSAPLGRFTSPDPLLNSGRPNNPQTWNRYAYVLNNPLRFIDPTGLYEWDTDNCKKDDTKCQEKRDADRNWFRNAVETLDEAIRIAEGNPDLWLELGELTLIRSLIGTEGDKGYIVSFDISKTKGQSGLSSGKNVYLNPSMVANRINQWNERGKAFDFRVESAGATVHEFAHKLDLGTAKSVLDTTLLRLNETQAYRIQSHVNRIFNKESAWELWNPSWSKIDALKLRDAAIGRNVEESVKKSFGQR